MDKLASNINELILKPLSWGTKLDFIERLILKNKVIPVILGEEAVGKTTFAQEVKKLLEHRLNTKYIKVDAEFDINILQNRDSSLFLLDDAHLLVKSQLEELLDKFLKDENLNICFIGLPQLKANLLALDKKYISILHTIEISTLTKYEINICINDALQSLEIYRPCPYQLLNEFYLITEGNLSKIKVMLPSLVHALNKPIVKKRYGFVTTIFSILIISSAMLYKKDELINKFFLPNAEPIVNIEPSLDSDIPFYAMKAQYHKLLPINLERQSKIASLAGAKVEILEEKPIEKSVIDKVLITPKIVQAKKIDDKKFTIQCMATHDISRLQYYIKKYPEAKIYKLKEWYVLAYGQYKDRQEAQTAMNTLAHNLIQLHPWIRESHDLQVLEDYKNHAQA